MHLLIGIETVAETIYHLAIEKLTGALPELAAQILGFERRTLYRKLERYGVAIREESREV